MKQIRGTLYLSACRQTVSLWASTPSRAEDHHASVQHPQAPLDFGSKVDMPRRVDDIDGRVAPMAGDGCGENCDPSLLFLGIKVGLRRPLIDVPHAVRRSRVIQDPLCRGRLACVDMGNNADISQL